MTADSFGRTRPINEASPRMTADAGSALDVAGMREVLMGLLAALPEDCLEDHDYIADAVLAEGFRLPAHVEALREADRADGWDEGYREAIEDYGTDLPWGGLTSDHNPYRSES